MQLAEIAIGGDIIVLATPEIAGLPYVISGLVAAGGLAAALSTADGLLLTIANALSHDLYYKMIDPNASTARRVTISKILLLVVALAAASVAAQKPADILFLVSRGVLAGGGGASSRRWCWGSSGSAPTSGARSLGMVAGLRDHVLLHGRRPSPGCAAVFGVTSPIADNIWWGIQPISAGLWGVPLGLPGDHRRQPADAGAGQGDAGPGRARALPEPRAATR